MKTLLTSGKKISFNNGIKKKMVITTVISILTILLLQVASFAATVITTNGTTIRGNLVERNDEFLILENPQTKNRRKVLTKYIKYLTLTEEEQKIAKKLEDKQKKEEAKKKSISYRIQPMVGLMPMFGYPIGDIGQGLNFGYGANFFFDLLIPLNLKSEKAKKFKMRMGIMVGFNMYAAKSADYTADVKMLPVVLYMKLLYHLDIGLRPYFKIAGGITPVLASGGMSMDPTMIASLGLGFVPKKAPFIEVFLEAGFMMAFESVRGDFINVAVGVAFNLGIPKKSGESK